MRLFCQYGIFFILLSQEELEKARNETEVLKFQVDELSEQLSLQTKVMGEMKEQRDNALRTKLRARFNGI
jgi:hypothetical protein